MKWRTSKYKLAVVFKIIFVLGLTATYTIIGVLSRGAEGGSSLEGGGQFHRRKLLALVEGVNCTAPAIEDFPQDGFTREERQQGWAALHAIAACYLFILLAIVCDDYFVPSIKRLCDVFRLKEDIAGATFMATASSSPELFINCVGTFITEGDLGVGTIVGSAVFNVLAVPACCGLVSNMVIQLEWWPITRDSIMYGISVLMLIFVLEDGRVVLWEAVMLVSAYVFYVLVMCYNDKITNAVMRATGCCRKKSYYKEVLIESKPLLDPKCEQGRSDHGTVTQEDVLEADITLKDCEDLEESTEVWVYPYEKSVCGQLFWIMTWPINFFLQFTTPDCRKYPQSYPMTFVMCVIWIGGASYMAAWMITVVGDTLEIPDSVMGLTFLAAGTSIPEAVSSIIVTNQGHGSMGLSSSIGSNTFDILLCLGLPWMIKICFYSKVPNEHFISINSQGLSYSALSLFSTLVMFYLSLACNGFKLDWKVGLTCLLMYIGFLTLASLIELNYFFPVNLPICDR